MALSTSFWQTQLHGIQRHRCFHHYNGITALASTQKGLQHNNHCVPFVRLSVCYVLAKHLSEQSKSRSVYTVDGYAAIGMPIPKFIIFFLQFRYSLLQNRLFRQRLLKCTGLLMQCFEGVLLFLSMFLHDVSSQELFYCLILVFLCIIQYYYYCLNICAAQALKCSTCSEQLRWWNSLL